MVSLKSPENSLQPLHRQSGGTCQVKDASKNPDTPALPAGNALPKTAGATVPLETSLASDSYQPSLVTSPRPGNRVNPASDLTEKPQIHARLCI